MDALGGRGEGRRVAGAIGAQGDGVARRAGGRQIVGRGKDAALGEQNRVAGMQLYRFKLFDGLDGLPRGGPSVLVRTVYTIDIVCRHLELHALKRASRLQWVQDNAWVYRID